MQTIYDLAISLLHIPYVYGGKNPLSGLDCSGLVVILLKAAGLAPPSEMNAQALYNYYYPVSSQNSYTLGALAFFGESVTKITHVTFILNPYQMLEAGHGDHTVTTPEIAKARGAYSRITLITNRRDLVAILKPSYAKIGCP